MKIFEFTQEQIDKLNELNKKEYNIKDNSDIVIKGLGFINIKKACNLTINTKYNKRIRTIKRKKKIL